VQVKAGHKNSLVLFGPVGTGKTAMLTEVARCWLGMGKVVLFVQYNRFIAAIQETYGGDGSWQELVEAAVNCDLLVLDDVGDPDGQGRAESSDRREKVFLVMNERYNLDRPVVLATNLLGKGEFRQVFGERIADRLGEMAAWVEVGGVNLRRA
jgi:DNA replication protein DnaC